MNSLNDHFDQFLRERVYLHNIAPKTREFYETAWKAFQRSQVGVPSRPQPAPLIARADVHAFVIHLRERGVRPTSCNCWLRGINAFTKWLHDQRAIPEPIRVRPQREDKVACTILDTGCRIDELLSASAADVDFDNLLLTVVGKGRKQRKVPLSTELRKVLFRFAQVKERSGVKSALIFPARDGGKWQHRNARRSFYCLLKNLGLAQSGFHLLRHTFATQYLRAGGDVVRLSIILGSVDEGGRGSLVDRGIGCREALPPSACISNRVRFAPQAVRFP